MEYLTVKEIKLNTSSRNNPTDDSRYITSIPVTSNINYKHTPLDPAKSFL